MINKKISELPLKTAPQPTDFMPIVDMGVTPIATKRTTFGHILEALSILQLNDVGVPNGVAGLNSAGKIPANQLPPIAVNNTFVVNSAAAMIALTAEVGDVAVRIDISKTFILSAEPASNVNNWVEFLASGIPETNQVDGGNF